MGEERQDEADKGESSDETMIYQRWRTSGRKEGTPCDKVHIRS